MSGFGFSEEEELFRNNIREFCQKELAPTAKKRSKDRRVDMSLLKKIGEIGILGMNAPEKYGGVKASSIMMGIAVEEISKVDTMYAVRPVWGATIGGMLIHCAPELQDKWFPPLVNGDIMGCACITEPDHGSDATAIECKAVKDGDSYVINGEKTSISWGMQSEIAVVYAVTDPTKGYKGVSAFLVPTDTPGIHKSSFEDMGWISADRASFIFEDCRIPANHLIGEEGKGFYFAMELISIARLGLAMEAIGCAEGALEEAIEYSKQRVAFGRPIAKFQGVAFSLAEHATRLEAARMLTYRALWLRDQGKPNMKETAMAKWLGARTAMNAAHDCLLVFGHMGYTSEYSIEQRLRDVIGNEIGDGMENIMKTIIAREIIGRDFDPI